jgi:hypothetical protein
MNPSASSSGRRESMTATSGTRASARAAADAALPALPTTAQRPPMARSLVMLSLIRSSGSTTRTRRGIGPAAAGSVMESSVGQVTPIPVWTLVRNSPTSFDR